MASSLATQLQKNISLNAGALVDRSKRKTTDSYLFSGRDAAQYDLESIHAIATNAFTQLVVLDRRLEEYEEILFSDVARRTDRTLLTKEQCRQLDKSIHNFLALLGPYLLDSPATKVLEWLIRRFRINEFNVIPIIALFLPYHETTHFAKMNTILHIPANSTWSFLIPFKMAAQSVPRLALVVEMQKNTDVASFVTTLLPDAIKGNYSHDTLVAFNAATLHDFISRAKTLDEGTLAMLLPALVDPLQNKSASNNVILGSYVLLATLSSRIGLSIESLRAITISMINSARRVKTRQFINAIIAVFATQDVESVELPDASARSMCRLQGIVDDVRSCSVYVGADKFLISLVKGLISRSADPIAVEILECFISTPTIMPSLTTTLLERYIAVDPAQDEKSVIYSLLVKIQQRDGETFSEVIKQSENEEIERLATELTIIPSQSLDAVLSSTNADIHIRVAGIQELIHLLEKSNGSLGADDLSSIEDSLLARLYDTSPLALEALYSPNPSIVAGVFVSRINEYMTILSDALGCSDGGSKPPKRAVLKLHLIFLATHIFSSASVDLFRRVLWTFLLYSKPRQHTADLVWEVVETIPALGAYELLRGCVKAVKDAGTKESEDDAVVHMAQANVTLSQKLAENIIASDLFHSHIDFLLETLQSENSHSRCLGYLVASAVLDKLQGEQRISVAEKIITSLGVSNVADVSAEDVDQYKLVVTKPSSRSTSNQLQLLLFASISRTSRPTNVVLDWISDTPSSYVKLMRAIYAIASTVLIENLFIALQEDALLFLAGLWSNTGSPRALIHATSFLTAYLDSNQAVDFQTILPSLLVALAMESAETRCAAADCVTLLRKMIEVQKFQTVYAFDVVYGSSDHKATLQYLSQDDLVQYLQSLEDNLEHFRLDPSYITVFHQTYLSKKPNDNKKEADFKTRVLCFLLSHINTLSSSPSRMHLLSIIKDVSDSKKAAVLLPTFDAFLNGGDNFPYAEKLANLLATCFRLPLAKDLNAQETLWRSLCGLIKWGFSVSTRGRAVRETLTTNLERELLAKLVLPRKLGIANILLEIAAGDVDQHAYCKPLLSTIVQDLPASLGLLTSLQPDSEDGPPASKRPKLNEYSDDKLPRLGVLAEILASADLPGSLDLLSRLLETLSLVAQSTTPTQADITFIEQSLMSAMEVTAERIFVVPNVSPSVIRLDILVQLIRTSNNPQTFHQALMLISSLTRLTPDSVLRDVMPIFTFMGSNVFHRDDAYSFRVVQRTVDSIVPVMISNLRSKHPNGGLELLLDCRDFLRVFTDAAARIPRHRQTIFFTHLVDILGPDEFLGPLCMLLVQKLTNRILRRTDDVGSHLFLPLSVLHHYPRTLQITTLAAVLEEAQRLASRSREEQETQAALLDDALYEDSSLTPSVVFKRRVQALVLFVGFGAKSWTPAGSDTTVSMNNVIMNLLALTKISDDIAFTSRASLNTVLSVTSAKEFIFSTLAILEGSNDNVQIEVLQLLKERLPLIVDSVRRNLTPTVNQIVAAIQKALLVTTTDAFRVAGLDAVAAIGSSMVTGEEGSLTDIVPIILSSMKQGSLAKAALGALIHLPAKLGPRLLPYFREMVKSDIQILHEGSTDLVLPASELLKGLLSSIPTFWGGEELSAVLSLCVEHRASSKGKTGNSMLPIVKTVCKKVQSKTLLPTLISLWASLEQSRNVDRMSAFFDLLRRAIQVADRPVIEEHMRSIFQVYLNTFELISDSFNENFESQTISAFVEFVAKLNEATFEPLFRRIYDWAFVRESDKIERQTVFCHLYRGLLRYFNGLVTPYMSFLLQPLVDSFKKFAASTLDEFKLWAALLEVLKENLDSDDGTFWRTDKLRQTSEAIVAQIPLCSQHNVETERLSLQSCLDSLIERTMDDGLLKAINLAVLMHTRSEDAQTRIFSLSCAEVLWKNHGGKLLGFAGETTTFIAECTEDENDKVVRQSFKLKNAVESVAGNINGL